ncbi:MULTISPECIES: YdbH domain-containing protein [unclassified Gilliamella]|uniref:intermembrane phospholipid transport protein YdbH family protein n=1 Tax=unclassified Gilliamella TaxID=2685620 RepID=UPI001309BF05|nr:MULTISPECIES: YdbH domain-containing protein [unclassified Gilliamella]MWP49167.1 hypothetical protein [Gilliamella sp. Lep-s35]MWP68046.1 hypothetical protein [Gilliamella sp. Lep-s5]MWP76266.1 hypothetical protein [Gilliamella sp. Lep-s21]
MARLKKRYWILLSIVLIIMLLSLCVRQYWLSLKDKYQLSADWHGVSVSFNGLAIDEITVSQPSKYSLTAKNLLISLSQLSANELNIHWQSDDKKVIDTTQKEVVETLDKNFNQDVNQSDDASFISTILYWLPSKIHIDSLRFYTQNNEQFNVKIDITKQQEAIQLVMSTNSQYVAKLSANLQFNTTVNTTEPRIDIQNGLFTTTVNQFGIENGQLTLPFSGWVNRKQLSLSSLNDASISLVKASLSDDLILADSSGNLTFQVESAIPFDNNQLSATTQLVINKLNGIYKTSEIKSATGNINLVVKNNQFTISSPALNIQEVNMGLSFEKIKLVGKYFASINAPDKGTISWTKAQASIFSGLIFLDKNKLNLAKLPQQLNLKIKQIQLKDIFTQYPAEGLAGSGAIDGNLPIILLANKKKGGTIIEAVIKKGQLITTKDGYLQFENSALKNYVQSNPNMKILADIIKNFHYTKLSGTVDYANDIAKLGLNIQGSNLDVENGKAVNLNINLEENISKLLMSLQLSDQVSEPIRKRIEAHLKRKSSK